MTNLFNRAPHFGLALFTVLLGPMFASAQPDQSRRELVTPGLILETGSRTSACDVLSFTRDGQYVFTTGDDKVVRTFRFTSEGLQAIPDPPPEGVPHGVLRWASHRERRGNIYAAAISPDAKGQYIAVGGLGVQNSQFAILDRYTGAVVNAVPHLSLDPKQGGASIWAAAFSPSGDQVACGTGAGSVWVWNWKTRAKPVLLGQHENAPDWDYNYVRFLAYDKNALVSADEHGQVYRWGLDSLQEQTGPRSFTFANRDEPGMMIRFFARSADAKWLAAALEKNEVEIRSFDGGGGKKTIRFDKGVYPSALAFDPKSLKLAVSLRFVDRQSSFFKETNHQVVVYDVSGTPRPVLYITPTYRVEAMAFHPDGRHLATAGGNNHEVTAYDLGEPSRPMGKPVFGPGECIWNVFLSKDGRHIGFQTGRQKDPDHPNHRGAGPVKAFDLEKRLFTKTDGIAWSAPLEKSSDGWEVRFSTKDVERADQWFVQKGGPARPLPWVTKNEEYPRCYTFLPQKPGEPARLLVGHLYGVSMFELGADGPFRTRILSGHDAEVNGLSVSADGKRLITASRDQTIAGWSLEEWPSHPQLGANVFAKDGKLFVGTVDQGGPFWEAGLSMGDEIAFLAVKGKPVYNRGLVTPTGLTIKLKDMGTMEAAQEALRRPNAGIELYLGWRRPGEKEVRQALTTLRERPIWRFFPTRDNEWVLWRYQDFIYDTSTRGDSLIGWQRNMVDAKGEFNVRGTPVFYRAEQFRKNYHNPEKVSQTLQNWSRTGQGKSTFVDIEPPQIDLAVNGVKSATKIKVKDEGFRLGIKVAPNSDRQNQELTRVILWINDFQFMKWENEALRRHLTAKKNDVGLEQKIFAIDQVVVPTAMLREGENRVFVQSYNRADVRGESERVFVTNLQPRPKAALHGLFIGVGKYAKSSPRQINLDAPQDADVLADVWDRNRGGQYAVARMKVLRNEEVTPALVLHEFDAFAAGVKPDDLLVFHLGGHGLSSAKLASEMSKVKLPADQASRFRQQLPGLGQFLFLCGDFDFLRIRDTSISLDDLYEKLVKLPCHKVITLDACQSAAVDPSERKGSDIIRFFTQDGVGPIIFAACKADESALEGVPGFVVEPASGVFAQAIIKTIQDDFRRSKKGKLTPEDMYTGIKGNVGDFIGDLRKQPGYKDLSQNPQFFLPDQERNLAILVGKE